MTPTSEERREVAERLRKAADSDEWLDLTIENAIFGVFGEVRRPAADTLADLIEPPDTDGILHSRTTGELVRCRDCKWACVPDDDGAYDACLLACTWWMDVSRSSGYLFVEEDDFCSHGEKREGEQCQ